MRDVFQLLLVWLCFDLFCDVSMPVFPVVFVLIFLQAVLKKKKKGKTLLFEVFSSGEIFLAQNVPPLSHLHLQLRECFLLGGLIRELFPTRVAGE